MNILFFAREFYFKILSDKSEIYLVTQYLESDLRDVINGPEILNDDHVRYIMVQVLRALDYIHSAGVIHRDLTPNNIAITSDMEVRQWIYFLYVLFDCL